METYRLPKSTKKGPTKWQCFCDVSSVPLSIYPGELQSRNIRTESSKIGEEFRIKQKLSNLEHLFQACTSFSMPSRRAEPPVWMALYRKYALF
jgi:hypothetical protein